MHNHPARNLAMHDTTELERHERAERRAFFIMLAACAAFLACLVGAL